jgi:hypothetical protein
MIDLLWNAVMHIPGHIIRERTRIGNDNDSFQYVLVFEDWEFRVYMYEFLDEILEEIYNTENFREACDYFYNFDWYLNINSLSYTRLDLDWWVEKAIRDLTSYVLTYLDEEEIPRDLEGRITLFFKYNIEKIGTKVYQYYK